MDVAVRILECHGKRDHRSVFFYADAYADAVGRTFHLEALQADDQGTRPAEEVKLARARAMVKTMHIPACICRIADVLGGPVIVKQSFECARLTTERQLQGGDWIVRGSLPTARGAAHDGSLHTAKTLMKRRSVNGGVATAKPRHGNADGIFGAIRIRKILCKVEVNGVAGIREELKRFRGILLLCC